MWIIQREQHRIFAFCPPAAVDSQWHSTAHSQQSHRGRLCQGGGTRTSSTYWGWGIDDGEVVTVLERASNPSSTYCQDQDLVLKLKKRGRQWMASLHRIKWLNRHSDFELGDFPMAMNTQCIQDSLVCYYFYPFMTTPPISAYSVFPVMLHLLCRADNV